MKKLILGTMTMVLAVAMILGAEGAAFATYQCGNDKDDCTCGKSNPYPCCDNGGNCTWYAWHRACCGWGRGLPGWGNAKQWSGNAKNNGDFEVLDHPEPSTIGVSLNGTYGHVVWVLSVNGGTIEVAEQNCCGGCNYGSRTRTYNWGYFNGGFIKLKGYSGGGNDGGGTQPCGECRPGETQSQGCGLCGRLSRTCQSSCNWGGWSGCEGEGNCSPGETKTEDCGNCGNHTKTCKSNCHWSDWAECKDQGPCAPDTIGHEMCGKCGDHWAKCTQECQWGVWSPCEGEKECYANSEENRPCGNCGQEKRFCDSLCFWMPWMECANEGPCEAGTRSNEVCGKCGTRSMECSETCQWIEDLKCVGQGECVSGEKVPCGTCGTRTCMADCHWGSCAGDGKECDDGNCCTEDDFCDLNGQCVGSSTKYCGEKQACNPGTCQCQGCPGLPVDGVCDGKYLVKCDGANLLRTDCTFEGGACVVKDGLPVCGCKKSCEGVECGDDGCGGSCGDCEGDEECKAGLCVKIGGVVTIRDECGNAFCDRESENCEICLADCPCQQGEICVAGVCSTDNRPDAGGDAGEVIGMCGQCTAVGEKGCDEAANRRWECIDPGNDGCLMKNFSDCFPDETCAQGKCVRTDSLDDKGGKSGGCTMSPNVQPTGWFLLLLAGLLLATCLRRRQGRS